MKKIILSVLMASAVIFTGCGTEPKPTEVVSGECIVEGLEAPTWVCGNTPDGVSEQYSDVGIAPMSVAGLGFTRKEALANARGNLAHQIKVDIKDKVETFIQSTGIGANEVADKVSTQVSKQVTRMVLTGSSQKAFWQTPNNIYVLVVTNKSEINSLVKDKVSTSFKNDDALWQQYKAKNAQEALEKEFQ